MGSGRGKYVRSAFVIKEKQSFLEFRKFYLRNLPHLKKRLFFKIPLVLGVRFKGTLKFKY